MRTQIPYAPELKISERQGLPAAPRKGERYRFEKTIPMTYPLDTAINLHDDDQRVVAAVRVVNFTNDTSGVHGTFEVLHVYSSDESAPLSDNLRLLKKLTDGLERLVE